MSVAIIGVAGTVIGAGASIYATQSQKSNAKKAASSLNAGGKPKAAEYRPVDFNEEQWNAIHQNINSLGANANLMNNTNAFIDQDAINRATRLLPNYKQNMALEGQASNDLLSGRLPYDDVLGIVAKQGEASNALGVPGTSAPATLRDLGLSRLDAIKSGAGLMKGMVDIAEQIDPVSRRSRPQDMFVNPTDRIKMAIEQNQLIQQSDQSRNNLAAGISPTQSAQQQLQLAQGLGAIGGTPNYSQDIQSVIGSLSSAYKQYSASSSGYSTATDPQLASTGGYMNGVPVFTNRTAAPSGTNNLSYRPYSIAV